MMMNEGAACSVRNALIGNYRISVMALLAVCSVREEVIPILRVNAGFQSLVVVLGSRGIGYEHYISGRYSHTFLLSLKLCWRQDGVGLYYLSNQFLDSSQVSSLSFKDDRAFF